MDLDQKARSLSERWAATSDREVRHALRAEARSVVAEHEDELRETFAGMNHKELSRYTTSAKADGDYDAVARANVWALGALPQQRVVGGN